MTHPRNVYLREIDVALRLDRRLGRLFVPSDVARTVEALAVAGDVDRPEAAEIVALRRQIADCERRLGLHRAALKAGADPAGVAEWIRQEQKRKSAVEQRLARIPVFRPRRLDRDRLAAMLAELGDMVDLPDRADPEHKAKT